MKISKDNNEEIELVFENELPSIFILLKEELDKDKDVVMSAWKKEHPLINNVYFYLKVKEGKKAKEVLLKALKRLLDRISEFEEEYDKLLDE